mgnify:CR=1 FL=1
MEFEKLIKEREFLSESGQNTLMERAKQLQSALYAFLLDKVIAELETDEAGAFKFSVKNLQSTSRVGGIFSSYRKLSDSFGDWLIKQLLNLFGLNNKYFREVGKVSDSLEAKTRKLLFQNLGYDIEKKEIIKSSWLDNLLAQETVKQQVINRLSAAIQSKMDAKTFRTQFRDAFLDNNAGLGLVTKNMDFHTQNIFMSFDRAAQAVYKEQLGLEHAIYSGTIMQPTKSSPGTRSFCWRRVNNLYDNATINEWNKQDWAGKIEGSDVKVTAGGYRCRHHFSWVSKEIAEQLQKKGKVLNHLNPPKPDKKAK